MTTKTLSPRILRKIFPNPQCVWFEVNTRISTDYYQRFDFPLRERSEKYIDKIGPIGAALVRKINEILGCESATLKLYGVEVVVGDAFNPDSDGITGALIEALKDCFGDKRDDVEVVAKR